MKGTVTNLAGTQDGAEQGRGVLRWPQAGGNRHPARLCTAAGALSFLLDCRKSQEFLRPPPGCKSDNRGLVNLRTLPPHMGKANAYGISWATLPVTPRVCVCARARVSCTACLRAGRQTEGGPGRSLSPHLLYLLAYEPQERHRMWAL